MESPLKTLCFASVKHSDGLVSRSLAIACLLPYFSLIYQASAAYVTRDIPLIIIWIGSLINVAISFSIKKTLRWPRPLSSCVKLDKCSSPGMPSSHAQVMGYALAAYIALHLRRRKWRRNSKIPSRTSFMEALEIVALAIATGSTCVARMILGYHNAAQVFAGCFLGIVIAICIVMVVEALNSAGYMFALRSRFGRWLSLRNSWNVAHAHSVDAFCEESSKCK